MAIAVRCHVCGNKTLLIKPGDKFYCLTEECSLVGERYPSGAEIACNRHAHYVYVVKLETELLEYRKRDREAGISVPDVALTRDP